MQYLVEMKLADPVRPHLGTPPQEAVAFLHTVISSLEILENLRGQNKVLAGGPIGGAIEVSFIVEVDTIHELDQMLEGLPFWPRMVTNVTPLTTFKNRVSALGHLIERLKAQAQGAGNQE